MPRRSAFAARGIARGGHDSRKRGERDERSGRALESPVLPAPLGRSSGNGVLAGACAGAEQIQLARRPRLEHKDGSLSDRTCSLQDRLRQRAETHAQQRRGAAVAARPGRTLKGRGAAGEGAAGLHRWLSVRERGSGRLTKPMGGQSTRTSATVVPTVRRDRAHESARAAPLASRLRRPKRRRLQRLVTGPTDCVDAANPCYAGVGRSR